MYRKGQFVRIIKDLFGHEKEIGSVRKILDTMPDCEMPYLIEKPNRKNIIGIWISDEECKRFK